MFACTERIAFYLGSYPIMKYGITMGIAIAVAIVLLLKFRKKYYPEFSEDTLVDLTFWLVIAGVVGARLWFVLLNLSYFAKNPFEILMINHGGISIQGLRAVLPQGIFTLKNTISIFSNSLIYMLSFCQLVRLSEDGVIFLIRKPLADRAICLGNYISRLKTDRLRL